jgi:hypothetical protein
MVGSASIGLLLWSGFYGAPMNDLAHLVFYVIPHKNSELGSCTMPQGMESTMCLFQTL